MGAGGESLMPEYVEDSRGQYALSWIPATNGEVWFLITGLDPELQVIQNGAKIRGNLLLVETPAGIRTPAEIQDFPKRSE